MDVHASGIPVVDLGINGFYPEINGCTKQHQLALEVLDALKNIGFVYLTNNGLSREKIARAFDISTRLLKLPDSVTRKTKFTIERLDGYTGIGDEVFSTGPADWKEAYDIALNKHVYPREPPEFQEIIKSLIDDLVDLSTYVLQLMADGMGFPKNTFADLHRKISQDGNSTIFRTLYYPPVTEAKDDVTRCGAHTDYGTITLLIQDEAGGLQVRNRNDDWIDAAPVPGAVLVNLGDLFEILTGGELRATEHRVIPPIDQGLRSRSRSSMVLFLTADDNVLVEPITGDKEGCKAVNAKDYFVKRLKETYI